jgi:hypothetical protein
VRIDRSCENCGKSFYREIGQLRRDGYGRFCSRKCHYEWRKTQPHKPVVANGRIRIFAPDNPMAGKNGYVYRYRLEMAKIIGRPLTGDEIVHHGNEITHDDSPANLEVKTAHEHGKEHAAIRAAARGYNFFTEKLCPSCGLIKPRSEFSPTTSRGKRTLNSRCKPCSASWQREYRKVHPERTRLSLRNSYLRRAHGSRTAGD